MNHEEKHYEFTFIIPGNAPENEHPGILEKLKTEFEKNQARNIVNGWAGGRKKLAYPIKQLRHGFYFTWEFDLTAEKLSPLEKEVKLNKNVLRYMIVNKRIKTAEEIAKETKVKDRQIQEQIKKEKEAAQQESKKEIKERPKVSLDDLDKKLDELLSDEVIK